MIKVILSLFITTLVVFSQGFCQNNNQGKINFSNYNPFDLDNKYWDSVKYSNGTKFQKIELHYKGIYKIPENTNEYDLDNAQIHTKEILLYRNNLLSSKTRFANSDFKNQFDKSEYEISNQEIVKHKIFNDFAPKGLPESIYEFSYDKNKIPITKKTFNNYNNEWKIEQIRKTNDTTYIIKGVEPRPDNYFKLNKLKQIIEAGVVLNNKLWITETYNYEDGNISSKVIKNKLNTDWVNSKLVLKVVELPIKDSIVYHYSVNAENNNLERYSKEYYQIDNESVKHTKYENYSFNYDTEGNWVEIIFENYRLVNGQSKLKSVEVIKREFSN